MSDPIIEAIRLLSRKLSDFLYGQGDLTQSELQLAVALDEWYVTKGIPLIEERRRQAATSTLVDQDEYRVGIKWGGKDGKWRWLVERGDGQAQAGEERVFDNAFSAAHRAALAMQ